MTKRKVTDLLPSEAILISSDAERDEISKLLDDLNIRWCGGERLVYYKASMAYPYCFTLDENLIWHDSFGFCKGVGKTIYPATEFIQTESDEVVGSGIVLSEPDDSFTIRINPDYERQLLVDYHNFILDDPKAKECDVVGESVELFLKTRNTPNQ